MFRPHVDLAFLICARLSMDEQGEFLDGDYIWRFSRLGSLDVRFTGTGRMTSRRMVSESLRPGPMVSEVAERHRLKPNHLSTWRTMARQGKLAYPHLRMRWSSQRCRAARRLRQIGVREVACPHNRCTNHSAASGSRCARNSPEAASCRSLPRSFDRCRGAAGATASCRLRRSIRHAIPFQPALGDQRQLPFFHALSVRSRSPACRCPRRTEHLPPAAACSGRCISPRRRRRRSETRR